MAAACVRSSRRIVITLLHRNLSWASDVSEKSFKKHKLLCSPASEVAVAARAVVGFVPFLFSAVPIACFGILFLATQFHLSL